LALVCFNKHIENSVLWRMFPVAGCNPVDILSRVAVRWFDSIILHQTRAVRLYQDDRRWSTYPAQIFRMLTATFNFYGKKKCILFYYTPVV
jgi:hypothetical protein